MFIVFTYVFGSKKIIIVFTVSCTFTIFLSMHYLRTFTVLHPSMNFLQFCAPTSNSSALCGSPHTDGKFPEQLSDFSCSYLTSGKYRWDRSDRKTRRKTLAATERSSGNERILEIERVSTRPHCEQLALEEVVDVS